MTRLRLKFVHRFKDRHGRVRHYFRRAGFPRLALPGLPGSAEFMEAYQAALAGTASPIGADRTMPGSVSALVVAWYGCAEFKQLAPITQATYRHTIERFRAENGDKPVALLQPHHVREMIAERAETPTAANRLLSLIRILMRFAVENDWRRDDPTIGVRRVRYQSDGFHTWTEEEIAAFEAKWPLGTRARLALALLLYTGQRRADVVRMGRQHVRGGVIELRQSKTGARLAIPMHAALRAALDACPSDHLTFLVTLQGTAFKPTGFYTWFADRGREAGLPKGCSPHGRRKAAARRLAEAGCTTHQIAAVTGHTTLREIERYTKAANQGRLAEAAMQRIGTKSKPES